MATVREKSTNIARSAAFVVVKWYKFNLLWQTLSFEFQEVEQPSSMVYVKASELFPKKTLTSGLCQISRCVIVFQGAKRVCCCPELTVFTNSWVFSSACVWTCTRCYFRLDFHRRIRPMICLLILKPLWCYRRFYFNHNLFFKVKY